MRNKFISSLAGAAFSFAVSGLAFAQIPPSAPAPVYNWTGWYVGGNVGVSFGRAKTDFNVAPTVILGQTVNPGFANPDNEVEPSGFVGGGQIGYNWQYSPLIVVGLEADFQGSLERDSANFSNPIDINFIGSGSPIRTAVTDPIGTAFTDYTTKIDWFGTVRGRVGYVFGDGAVLTYPEGWLTAGWGLTERTRSAGHLSATTRP